MPKAIPVADRFLAKVQWSDQRHDGTRCLEWTSARRRSYGSFTLRRGVVVPAHRWLYERWVGPIPDGLQIDHLCRNTICVNPAHLEAVTAQVNQHRSNSVSGLNARKTHCKRGHEFTEENTLLRGGRRHCRLCVRLRGQGRPDATVDPDSPTASELRALDLLARSNHPLQPREFALLMWPDAPGWEADPTSYGRSMSLAGGGYLGKLRKKGWAAKVDDGWVATSRRGSARPSDD